MRDFLILVKCLIFSSLMFAQTGQTDLRFVIDDIDCENNKLFVILELKAFSAMTNFNLADQNYRFSFTRALDNPALEEELEISGFVNIAGTNSFYGMHTLTGSLDTVVSYNIELSGGDGYPIDEENWIQIGKISFDIVDPEDCFNIRWHTKDPIDFPPTFVAEKFDESLLSTEEGTYESSASCFTVACNTAPSAEDDFATTEENVPVDIDVLSNDSDPDGNLDPSTVTIANMPPASQAVVSVNPVNGMVTVNPTVGFSGNINPFNYVVCDIIGACSTGTIQVNVIPLLTNVNEVDLKDKIAIYPTITDQDVTIDIDSNINTEELTIQVLNNLGQLVINNNTIQNTTLTKVSLVNLPSGYYFFHIRLEHQVLTQKVFKH